MSAIFDWLDFKEVADELSRSTDEAFIRSAITRYYYAIFSAIREYLIYVKDQYLFISNFNIHKRVWKFLVASDDDNENEIGEFLNNLRYVRNSADYDKKHDYEFFADKLRDIHNNIDTIVDSVLFLRRTSGWR